MKNFQPIDPKLLKDNLFQLLDDEWMLVTAGDPGYFNTMTASWGGFGIMWNRPVGIALVRPQRFTRKFIDSFPVYSLCFFDSKYREALNICGSKSGRFADKVAEARLNAAQSEQGCMYFTEARLVLECRKLYQDDFHEHLFLLPEVPRNFYPSKDFHRFYIGEITHAWQALK